MASSNGWSRLVSSPDPDSQQLRVDYITATWKVPRSGDVSTRSCWESGSGDETRSRLADQIYRDMSLGIHGDSAVPELHVSRDTLFTLCVFTDRLYGWRRPGG